MTPNAKLQIIRDAAAIEAFAIIIWLSDNIAAYAAGARWFTWRFALPSLGLLLAIAWIALALSFPFRRRLPVALTILAFGGAFLLWTYRLSLWPARVTPWIVLTILIAVAAAAISRLSPRTVIIAGPLLVVGYHIAKSIRRDAFAATLQREMPAVAVAIMLTLLIWLVARTSLPSRQRLQVIVAACGGFVAIIGLVALLLWSGVSFPIVTSENRGHGRATAGLPNIVMILIDTLRVDRLGAYGYRVRPTSPFIDQLATHADLYRNAYATSSWTVPSVATMFSGLSPEQHGVVVYGTSLPTSVPTLAERLRRHGYATLAVVSNYLIDVEHGFGRGFDRFSLLVRINSLTGEPSPIWIDLLLFGHYWMPGLFPHGTSKPSATTVVDEALRQLDLAPRDRPLFLYLHFLDPHHPCDAPATEATREWRPVSADHDFDAAWSVAYDREVRYVDDQLGRFFDAARSRLGSNVIVVIVADHGEELGERGQRGHGSNLDEAVVRVPLLVTRPARAGSVFEEPFSLSHLPDLVEASAMLAPHEAVRAHLVPPPSLETTMTAVVQDGWKLVTTDIRSDRNEQLFRLPYETRDQLANEPRIANALRMIRDAMPRRTAAQVIDPEMRAKMRALGYIH